MIRNARSALLFEVGELAKTFIRGTMPAMKKFTSTIGVCAERNGFVARWDDFMPVLSVA
jgi:hypothetical protein